MLRTIVDVEDDRYLRIEAVDTQRREIWFGIKNQPVRAVGHRSIDEEERFHTPVGVGPCMAQLGPTLIGVLKFETDRHTTSRRSSGRIEYMGRNRAHRRVQFTKELRVNYAELSNFFNLNAVILACSAAARRSSVSESCWRRSCSAASISADDLPVAQMMKIKPNFCS